MADRQNPFQIRGVREVYDNPWIRVAEHDVVRPDGDPGLYGVVDFKNLAIAILPIDSEGFTYLVGQYRFPLERYSWEIPEGGGAVEQDPLLSAERELKEETGLVAQSWHELLRMELSNSITNERAIGYVAHDLERGEAERDGAEVLELRRLPFAEVLSMALSGEITDALSLAMIFKARLAAQTCDAPVAIRDYLLA